MMESVLDHISIDEKSLDRADHLKCGEVISWLCAGESYAVVCQLCEDRPVCPLSEFPQHMEIWHTDWQEDLKGDNDHNEDQFFDYEDHNDDHDEDDHALSITTEDSGCLFESDDLREQNERVPNLDRLHNIEEIPEPFEQVLIEQESNNNEDHNQTREEVNGEEECLKNEVNKQVAKVLDSDQDQRSNLNINKTLNARTCKQNDHANVLAEKERRELHCSEEQEESQQKLNPNQTNDAKENENLEKISKKIKKSRKFLKNTKEIEEHLMELSGNETSEEEIEQINEKYQKFNKSNKEAGEKEKGRNENETNELNCSKKLQNSLKNLENNLKICQKTRKSKRNLKLNKAINENETTDHENIETIGKTKKSSRNFKDILTQTKDFQQNCKNSKVFEILTENQTETSEIETKHYEHFEIIRKNNNFKRIAHKLRENQTEISENETSDTTNIEISTKPKKVQRNFKGNLKRTKDFKVNLRKERFSKELRNIEAELKENETETSETETVASENEKTRINFKESLKNQKDFKKNSRNPRVSQELSENQTETSENETDYHVTTWTKSGTKKINRNFRKNLAKLTDLQEQSENEIELSENQTGTSENETITSENEAETSEQRKTRASKELSENEIATSENETETSENETIISEQEIETLDKSNFHKNLNNFDDSFKSIPQNLRKIRKCSINLRKNVKFSQKVKKTKRNANNSKENFQKIKPATANKRKLTKNQEKLREEERKEMKHEEFQNSETDESKFEHKLRKSSRNEAQTASETRTTRRNLRNCFEDFSEEEQEFRTFEVLKQLQEFLKNATRQSSRASKRKNSWKTNNETSSEDLTPTKKSRRDVTCESTKILEEELLENSLKQEVNKNSKQTLVTHYFRLGNKEFKEKSSEISQNSEQISITRTRLEITDNSSLNSFNISEDYVSSKDSSSPTPLSPFSPKTEEEDFEFYGPRKEKLNKCHIKHLIHLYREHPRLWEQSHPEFYETELCRKSWQLITEQWNEFCQREFSTAEVRIRLGTLCQRYVEERERLALEGELDEFAKFPYYEEMQFLEQQESLQKRSELYEQQNEKILKIYQLFPLLWHVNSYKLRQSKERAEAFENISQTLKLSGLQLSSMAVQKRIRSLKKCYRLEKIRFLHAQVEQMPFECKFSHYERMRFLHKHIEPFRCRICGRIFENLSRFREHLDEENHGDVLQEDSETEAEKEEQRKGNVAEISETLLVETSDEIPAPATSELENSSHNFQTEANKEEQGKGKIAEICETLLAETSNEIPSPAASEFENSSDILQTFTPLSSSPLPNENVILDSAPIIQEVIIFPPPTPTTTFIDSMQQEHQLMEEIMENISNDDDDSQKSLDEFINSVTSSEVLSPISDVMEESLSSNVINAEIEVVTSNNIITEESLTSIIMEAEIPIVFHDTPVQPDQNDQNNQVSSSVTNEEEMNSELIIEPQETIIDSTENPSSPLEVKVQSDKFSSDLLLNSQPFEILDSATSNDSDNEFYSKGDISTFPLADLEIHKMISLYRKYPQIWNPNHLDYNSRNLRRQAWCQLTKEFSVAVGRQFSWRTLHRKLTDYAKYYKKLISEHQNYEELENKWAFYEDFKFLDDVLVVHDEIQRSVHHRDNNFKIIKIYESLPQLWNIKHPDYSKRSSKQRLIELMCNRLQEECNLQLTTERLKHRLIELRGQYRAAKKQRLKCERNGENFQTDLEFYEALKFLDPHIDPFICETCDQEFKKLTDYNLHLKRGHEKPLKEKPAPILLPLEPGVDKNLQNICHICGIKFTTRSNLAHHVRRHEGVRNFECPMCPKKFFASHPLKVHIRSHTKECPYTCEKCGMSFVSASKLNQHVKRHLNKKDFQCDYCPKTFYSGFEKDRHERRHLNIRDKVCPICGKSFVAGSSYYAHMMLHSDTKRFECEICEMKFAQYAGLYKHKKKYHLS